MSKESAPKKIQIFPFKYLLKTEPCVNAVQINIGIKIKAYCENCLLSIIIAKYKIKDIIAVALRTFK